MRMQFRNPQQISLVQQITLIFYVFYRKVMKFKDNGPMRQKCSTWYHDIDHMTKMAIYVRIGTQ